MQCVRCSLAELIQLVCLSHTFMPSQADGNNDFNLTIRVICGKTSWFNSKLIANEASIPIVITPRLPTLQHRERARGYLFHLFWIKPWDTPLTTIIVSDSWQQTEALITQKWSLSCECDCVWIEWQARRIVFFIVGPSRLPVPGACLPVQPVCTLTHMVWIILFLKYMVAKEHFQTPYRTEDRRFKAWP